MNANPYIVYNNIVAIKGSTIYRYLNVSYAKMNKLIDSGDLKIIRRVISDTESRLIEYDSLPISIKNQLHLKYGKPPKIICTVLTPNMAHSQLIELKTKLIQMGLQLNEISKQLI